MGRPSIPPEMLLRAMLLQAFFSVRSERMLMDQIDDNLLFQWFVGLEMDAAIWHPTVFTHHRDRLLEADVARAFLSGLHRQEARSNETHASTMDPDARLSRKADGQESRLCFMGHALMANRHGLVVDADLPPPPERPSGRRPC